jgi:4-alpha-glucanotransferase
VVYTGTHDNDTTVGWFRCLSDREKDLVKEYLRTDGSDISWALMRCAYGTVARTVIVPLQDILGRDSDGRMNLPGQMGSNWSFRMTEHLSAQCAKDLRHVADLYERSPSSQKKK